MDDSSLADHDHHASNWADDGGTAPGVPTSGAVAAYRLSAAQLDAARRVLQRFHPVPTAATASAAGSYRR